jgi:hypothetical protein
MADVIRFPARPPTEPPPAARCQHFAELRALWGELTGRQREEVAVFAAYLVEQGLTRR